MTERARRPLRSPAHDQLYRVEAPRNNGIVDEQILHFAKLGMSPPEITAALKLTSNDSQAEFNVKKISETRRRLIDRGESGILQVLSLSEKESWMKSEQMLPEELGKRVSIWIELADRIIEQKKAKRIINPKLSSKRSYWEGEIEKEMAKRLQEQSAVLEEKVVEDQGKFQTAKEEGLGQSQLPQEVPDVNIGVLSLSSQDLSGSNNGEVDHRLQPIFEDRKALSLGKVIAVYEMVFNKQKKAGEDLVLESADFEELPLPSSAPEKVSIQEAMRIILGTQPGKEVAVEVDSESRIVFAKNEDEDLKRALNRERVRLGLNGPGSSLGRHRSGMHVGEMGEKVKPEKSEENAGAVVTVEPVSSPAASSSGNGKVLQEGVEIALDSSRDEHESGFKEELSELRSMFGDKANILDPLRRDQLRFLLQTLKWGKAIRSGTNLAMIIFFPDLDQANSISRDLGEHIKLIYKSFKDSSEVTSRKK